MFPLSSLSEAEKVLREISGYNVQVLITSSIYHFLQLEVSVTICYCNFVRQITLAHIHLFIMNWLWPWHIRVVLCTCDLP